MARKVLVLTSGGLDSILTLKIMEKAGLDVIGLHFVTWFNIPKYKLLNDIADGCYIYKGFQINYIDISKEYTDILLSPSYGYGSAVNPCIDCKILFFKKAKSLMDSFGADFIATGEVLGQRPMTQKLSIMKMIENRSDLTGYLLRPLSAKLLDPTIPEKLQWVNRDDLYGISGRGRKKQMELASDLGIAEYPSPAGGCILTEKQFKVRFKDLVSHTSSINIEDLSILRYGRHFRLSTDCKLVIGRNQKENEVLERILWGNIKIDTMNIPGPFSTMEWPGKISLLKMAFNIIARYSDYCGAPEHIQFRIKYNNQEKTIIYRGTPDEILSESKIIR